MSTLAELLQAQNPQAQQVPSQLGGMLNAMYLGQNEPAPYQAAYPQREFGSIADRPTTPTEAVNDIIANQLGGGRSAQRQAGRISGALEMLPGTGDAIGAANLGQAVDEGNFLRQLLVQNHTTHRGVDQRVV